MWRLKSLGLEFLIIMTYWFPSLAHRRDAWFRKWYTLEFMQALKGTVLSPIRRTARRIETIKLQ